MNVTRIVIKYLPISILLVTLSSVNQWTTLPIGNTTMWWSIYAIILFSLIIGKKIFNQTCNHEDWSIRLFLIIVVFSFLYGAVIAEYYWDWKKLISNLMVFLLPLSVYVFSNPAVFSKTYQVWLRYALLFFPIFLFFIHGDAYGKYLFPISFLLLFFPKLPFRWKMIGIACVLFLIIGAPDARSNVLKFIIPLLLSFLFYVNSLFNEVFSRRFFKLCALFLFILPFVLFLLAVSGTFNVFRMSDYMSGLQEQATITSADGQDESLLRDSRTFLYVEELESAIKNDYWLQGRSMARGYDSRAFAGSSVGNQVLIETGRHERPACEVSILNVFNYFGLIGVIVYFFIFATASLIAITRSNNVYLQLVGVYVAFRWAYAWVEDFSSFDLNYLFLWIFIGMCFSVSFRTMSNQQFENWLHGLLQMKENLALKYYISQFKTKVLKQ